MKETALRPNFLETTQAKKKMYQRMIRSLIFCIVEIKPNIVFFIAVATRFAKNSSHAHTKTIKTIFYYLKRLMDCDITYGVDRRDFSIIAYLDSN